MSCQKAKRIGRLNAPDALQVMIAGRHYASPLTVAYSEPCGLCSLEAPRDLVGQVSIRVERATPAAEPQYPDATLVFEVIVGVCHLASTLGAEERQPDAS